MGDDDDHGDGDASGWCSRDVVWNICIDGNMYLL